MRDKEIDFNFSEPDPEVNQCPYFGYCKNCMGVPIEGEWFTLNMIYNCPIYDENNVQE